MTRAAEPASARDGASGAIASVLALPDDWHLAGTLSNRALRYLDSLLRARRAPVTAETGAGRSTLLFSWRSRAHTVFALDTGDSVNKPLNSPLRGPAALRLVEGPTQETLAHATFSEPLDLVLLDGPHGFPFTAFEYLRLYPHVRTGGVLVVDDVQIPSVGDLYRFLRADDMWAFDRRIDNTAYFVRTGAPLTDPLSDSWWLQGYNRPSALRNLARRVAPGWVLDLRRWVLSQARRRR